MVESTLHGPGRNDNDLMRQLGKLWNVAIKDEPTSSKRLDLTAGGGGRGEGEGGIDNNGGGGDALRSASAPPFVDRDSKTTPPTVASTSGGSDDDNDNVGRYNGFDGRLSALELRDSGVALYESETIDSAVVVHHLWAVSRSVNPDPHDSAHAGFGGNHGGGRHFHYHRHAGDDDGGGEFENPDLAEHMSTTPPFLPTRLAEGQQNFNGVERVDDGTAAISPLLLQQKDEIKQALYDAEASTKAQQLSHHRQQPKVRIIRPNPVKTNPPAVGVGSVNAGSATTSSLQSPQIATVTGASNQQQLVGSKACIEGLSPNSSTAVLFSRRGQESATFSGEGSDVRVDPNNTLHGVNQPISSTTKKEEDYKGGDSVQDRNRREEAATRLLLRDKQCDFPAHLTTDENEHTVAAAAAAAVAIMPPTSNRASINGDVHHESRPFHAAPAPNKYHHPHKHHNGVHNNNSSNNSTHARMRDIRLSMGTASLAGGRGVRAGGGGIRGATTEDDPITRSGMHPPPLFERLVTEEVQEIKAYVRIIENQNRRLAELERVHGDLETRLEAESRGRQQLESTLEAREREWSKKFDQLAKDRDRLEEVVQAEETKNSRLVEQVRRKDQDIHRMLQRKYDHDGGRSAIRNFRQGGHPQQQQQQQPPSVERGTSKSPDNRFDNHRSPHEILAASGSVEAARARNVEGLLQDFFGL